MPSDDLGNRLIERYCAYANLCIGCDRFHEEVLGARLDAARGRRLAARAEPMGTG